MSRKIKHIIKMKVGYIPKTTGEVHRACSLGIPTDIAQEFPDDSQHFLVKKTPQGLLYIPINHTPRTGKL